MGSGPPPITRPPLSRSAAPLKLYRSRTVSPPWSRLSLVRMSMHGVGMFTESKFLEDDMAKKAKKAKKTAKAATKKVAKKTSKKKK